MIFFPSPNDLTYILSPAGLLVGLMGLLGEPGLARLPLLLINLPDGRGGGDLDEGWLSGLLEFWSPSSLCDHQAMLLWSDGGCPLSLKALSPEACGGHVCLGLLRGRPWLFAFFVSTNNLHFSFPPGHCHFCPSTQEVAFLELPKCSRLEIQALGFGYQKVGFLRRCVSLPAS